MSKSYKVIIPEKLADAAQQVLHDHGFEVDACPGIERQELLERIKEFDAILIRSKTQVDEELLDHAPELKVVGRAGVGVDNVDIAACTKRGIVVCNAPRSNSVSAAEQAMGLMLATARRTVEADASVRAGEWRRSDFKGRELFEKTLAIFGLGRIGALVAERAKAFGMNLVGYDPYVSDEHAESLGVKRIESLEEILPLADFITMHLPKTKETTNMISTDEIALMKDGVFLINAARGGIYDEAALAEGLKSGKIGGVGLDVYENEPPVDSPIVGLERTVTVPHLGASTFEAQDRAGVQIAEFASDALLDNPVPTALNMPHMPIDSMDQLEPYIEASRMAGQIAYEILDHVVGALSLEALGRLSEFDPEILTTSALRGVFADSGKRVNFVNARAIAEEQGVIVDTKTSKDAGDYISAVKVVAKNVNKDVSITMTVNTTTGDSRIVELMGYKTDLVIYDHLVIMRYSDKPGMLGQIGTILGEFDVDIRFLKVASKEESNLALVAMAVNCPVPDEARERLESGVVDEAWYLSF